MAHCHIQSAKNFDALGIYREIHLRNLFGWGVWATHGYRLFLDGMTYSSNTQAECWFSKGLNPSFWIICMLLATHLSAF